MFKNIIHSIKRFITNLKDHIKQWSRPTTIKLAAEALADLKRSRKDLIAENALLRQQLIVLNRQVKHPQLTPGDRMRLVGLARLTGFWQLALHIVQPDTLLRWHRDLFRRYWRRKSRPKKKRKLRLSPETIALIQQMAMENLTWGSGSASVPSRSLFPKTATRNQSRPGPHFSRIISQTSGLVISLLYMICSFGPSTSS